MRGLLLAVSVVFVVGAMCTGAPTEPTDAEPEPDKEIVIVPVPGAGDTEHWCCEYSDAPDGPKRFALVSGPAECNAKFADKSGRWTSGPECTPCCCKTEITPGDPASGVTYDLTTPTECAEDAGSCLAGTASECEGLGPGKAGKRKGGKAGDGEPGKSKKGR